jgi:phospholipid transport system substrate-binding protein
MTLPGTLLLSALFSLLSSASASPEDIVETTSTAVLEQVVELRPDYPQTADELEGELLRLLDPVIDFDAFARGVMGSRTYNAASPMQRAAFAAAFRDTLAQLYARALVTREITRIDIVDTVLSGNNRAAVQTHVGLADGTQFSVQYSMRLDGGGQWRARNIIIDGVNVGLTYRNQFASALQAENGDLDAVIASWPERLAQR